MFCFYRCGASRCFWTTNSQSKTLRSIRWPPCSPGMPERSGTTTAAVSLAADEGSLLVDDRRELCLIRNISAGRMLIRAYSAIPGGTRVSMKHRAG